MKAYEPFEMFSVCSLEEINIEDLRQIKKDIINEMQRREDLKKKTAIENFRKAFEEVQKCIYEISVEDYEHKIIINNFSQFHFED